jgi:hypothetical protein
MVPPGGSGIGDDLTEPRWIRRLAEMLSERIHAIDDARGRSWSELAKALTND